MINAMPWTLLLKSTEFTLKQKKYCGLSQKKEPDLFDIYLVMDFLPKNPSFCIGQRKLATVIIITRKITFYRICIL